MQLLKEDFINYAKKYYDEALETLKQLLKFPTVLDEYKPNSDAPFGIANKECLEFILDKAFKDGFNVKNCDNYAGHISYGSGDELFGILGHLDVVPAVGEWSHDPFDPIIQDNKLFARGTLDDKGGVVASYYALKMFKDLGIMPKKEVRIIVGCDEETGSRCMSHYFQTEKMPDMAFSPDAEFPLIYGEKGILSFDINGSIENKDIIAIDCGMRYNIVPDLAKLTVKNPNQAYLDEFIKKTGFQAKLEGNTYYFYGHAAHAMQPQDGVNAAYHMFMFMNDYYQCQVADYIVNYFDTNGIKQNIYINDIDMKELTINLGIVKYDGKELRLGYNLRVPTDSHVEVIKNGFNQALNNYSLLTLGEFHYSPRHFVSLESELVQGLLASYQEISGDYETKPFTIGGGTYARIMPNAVAFGPNFPHRPDICHQPDEHIYLEDFTSWIAIFASAIYKLCM